VAHPFHHSLTPPPPRPFPVDGGRRLTSLSAAVLASSLNSNTGLRELRAGFQSLGYAGTLSLLQSLRANHGLTLLCLENTYLTTSEGEMKPGAGAAVGALPPVAAARPTEPARPSASLFGSAAALTAGKSPAIGHLWSVVDSVCETRPVFCRVVLEFPERPRLQAAALRALDFDDADPEDDGLSWLRGRVAEPRVKKWTLADSVWARRAAEADSHDFFDTHVSEGHAQQGNGGGGRVDGKRATRMVTRRRAGAAGPRI